MHGVTQQVAESVEKYEVNPPRVDADGGNGPVAGNGRFRKALRDSLPKAQYIPVKDPVRTNRDIREPIHLPYGEPIAVKFPHDGAAGLSPQVTGQESQVVVRHGYDSRYPPPRCCIGDNGPSRKGCAFVRFRKNNRVFRLVACLTVSAS